MRFTEVFSQHRQRQGTLDNVIVGSSGMKNDMTVLCQGCTLISTPTPEAFGILTVGTHDQQKSFVLKNFQKTIKLLG
jgi:hypothetical protein